MQRHEKKEKVDKRVFVYCLLISTLIVGCNYSIIMNHTEGQASDMVDETSSATANPNVSIVPT
jgi:hypothetical protein